MIKTKRVYDPVDTSDGKRVLVDRLWPRGITKVALKLDSWLKDIAPSNALRQWYKHDPAKWDEFRTKYFAELDAQRPIIESLLAEVKRGDVTLLFGSKELQLNNAVALKEYLERSK